MTVAKSEVFTTAQAQPHNTTDTTEDRGLLTLPLGVAEAFPGWASSLWAEIQPILADRAGAAWQLALDTKPSTLLICSAVCLLGGFAVLAVALLASVLVLLLKLAAAVFAGVAIWQWISGAAKAGNDALVSVAQPVKPVAKKSAK